MIRRATLTDPVLDRMTRAIVQQIDPVRIVLFGSRARGDERPDSDYDLMVELATGDQYHEAVGKVQAAIRPATPRGVEVDVVVRAPGELAERRDDPGWMDWDIAREGVVLYPPNGVLFTETWQPKRVRESVDEPPRSVKEWLGRAAEDLLNIENNVESKRIPWSTVGFHAQQAAEKYLKALLIQRMIRPPRTHDLAELVTAARDAGYDLPDLAVECELLKPFAVDVRYPERTPIPDEVNGRVILAAGRRIVDLARPHLD